MTRRRAPASCWARSARLWRRAGSERVGQNRDGCQAQSDNQHGTEPNGDAVILPALIDRTRRVEQHELFLLTHHGEIGAQDDCPFGQQRQLGTESCGLHVATITSQSGRDVNHKMREFSENLHAGQDPCNARPVQRRNRLK